MSEWRDISTAPKDGTRVLLGRFAAEPAERNGRVKVDWWRRSEHGHGFTGFGEFNTAYWPATHWCPLPTPPEETAP